MTYGVRVGKHRKRRSTGMNFRYKKNAKKCAHRLAKRKHHGFNPRAFKHKKHR